MNRQLIDTHPGWNRTKLSVHIAQRWQWRNHVGQLKDMACRSMLLKLEQKGLICLPARQNPSIRLPFSPSGSHRRTAG